MSPPWRLPPQHLPVAACLHGTADHRLMRRRPRVKRLLEEDDLKYISLKFPTVILGFLNVQYGLSSIKC
jgi:hypothetical protein